MRYKSCMSHAEWVIRTWIAYTFYWFICEGRAVWVFEERYCIIQWAWGIFRWEFYYCSNKWIRLAFFGMMGRINLRLWIMRRKVHLWDCRHWNIFSAIYAGTTIKLYQSRQSQRRTSLFLFRQFFTSSPDFFNFIHIVVMGTDAIHFSWFWRTRFDSDNTGE